MVRVVRATPAGDFDYEAAARTYSAHRRPDPVIAAQIAAALGDARTVLNVGAGAGSYEPHDRLVLAVEPSASMRSQRPAADPGDRRGGRGSCPSTTTRSTRRWRR